MTDLHEAMARCSSEQLAAIAEHAKSTLSFATATEDDAGVDGERLAPRTTERTRGIDELQHSLLHAAVQEMARRRRAAIELAEELTYAQPAVKVWVERLADDDE